METLQDVGDPYDPYVLQKAALLACGVIPGQGGELDAVLARMGGGFRMDTEVTGVPKGSGLGTSSILAAACVKALSGFLGDCLYGRGNLWPCACHGADYVHGRRLAGSGGRCDGGHQVHYHQAGTAAGHPCRACFRVG